VSACLPLCIETPLVGGHALRVEFVWHGDRYRHLIAVARPDGSSMPCFESVEGGAADPWPPSPPLQSLSIETLPDGRRVALLVGMAGNCHWSASIEPSASGRSLVFDIACRVAGPNPILGSQYLVSKQAGDAVPFAADDCSWCEARLGGVDVLLIPATAAASRSKLERIDEGRCSITPDCVEASATIRWKYELRLADGGATGQ
jgi:hypothetical protein